MDAVAQDPVLLSERRGRVAVLTLNRPLRLNALSGELHAALREALRSAARDDAVGAVVLTGAGRAFCSGGDVGVGGQRQAATHERRIDELLERSESARLLHGMPKPTLAMINGVAAGAGLTLALACDLRFIAATAGLTTAYAKVALSGDYGISWFLPRLVGAAKARELMLLSDKVDAVEALRLGLVNGVEPDERLADAVLAVATRLADGPGVALRCIKENLVFAERHDLEAVFRQEAASMVRCGRSSDVAEAAVAFREKRRPVFKSS